MIFTPEEWRQFFIAFTAELFGMMVGSLLLIAFSRYILNRVNDIVDRCAKSTVVGYRKTLREMDERLKKRAEDIK